MGKARHPGLGGKAAKERRQTEQSLKSLLGDGGAVRLFVLLLKVLLPGGQAKQLEQVLSELGPLALWMGRAGTGGGSWRH